MNKTEDYNSMIMIEWCELNEFVRVHIPECPVHRFIVELVRGQADDDRIQVGLGGQRRKVAARIGAQQVQRPQLVLGHVRAGRTQRTVDLCGSQIEADALQPLEQRPAGLFGRVGDEANGDAAGA